MTRPDLVVDGLLLWIRGREFEDSDDDWDGNWMHVVAQVTAPGTQVKAAGALLHLSECQQFRDGCQALHDTLQGEAVLGGLEPNLRITLRAESLGHIRCELRITPDPQTQHHQFDSAIDQSHLPAILRDLDDVLRRFPIRGNP